MSLPFRWEMEDGWDAGKDAPRLCWSAEHVPEGGCSQCCCGGPSVCARCGGRLHSEPVTAYDVNGDEEVRHSYYCQKERTADGEPARVMEEQS